MAKTFKGEIDAAAISPARKFISAPEPEEAGTDARAPEPDAPKAARIPFTRKPEESRSKRIQVLLKPSTYDRISAAAEMYGASVNEIINRLVEHGLDELNGEGGNE